VIYPLGAKVNCTDGPVGKSVTVIVNPVTEQVTHVVVEDASAPHPMQRLVPVFHVSECKPAEICLDVTRADLAKMDPFVEEQYIRTKVPDHGAVGALAYPDLRAMPFVTRQDVAYVHEHVEHVPPGKLAIHRGDKVLASDGQVGRVGEFLVDCDQECMCISHLVLRQGHLWGQKEITVPMSAVDRVSMDTVYLKLDKQAIAALPTIPLQRYRLGGGAEPDDKAGAW
jgi:hypothetical protein